MREGAAPRRMAKDASQKRMTPGGGAKRAARTRRDEEVVQDEQARKKEAFIEGLRKTGTLTGACKYAHVSPHTVYSWEEDADFFRREREARDVVADRLEETALERALDPADSKGHILLIFMLKALRPEKYRESVTVRQEDHLSPEVRQVLRDLASAAHEQEGR